MDDIAPRRRDAPPTNCWLCARPLGRRIDRHHPCPKSRGGRLTVPVHPICHRAIHAAFTNAELERLDTTDETLSLQPVLQNFLGWIAGKPPDFHAPTRARATDRTAVNPRRPLA